MIGAIALGAVAAGCAVAALRGGDSKRPQPTYPPVPEGRYKPQAKELDAVLLGAAKGVWREP